MVRLSSIVALLVVALVAAPLVLDACDINCVGARPQGAMAGMPGHCHMHGTERGWRAPAGCGHDHHAVTATIGAQPSSDRNAVIAAGVVARPIAVRPALDVAGAPFDSPPRPPLVLVTPLRI